MRPCAWLQTAGGKADVIVAGQVSDGVAYASYPLADDGNYQFWVFSDAYKATITKEKGKEIEEVEEDVTESWNLACLLGGYKTDPFFSSQGVRINGSKYTVLRELGKQTYTAKVSEGMGLACAPAPRCHLPIDHHPAPSPPLSACPMPCRSATTHTPSRWRTSSS